MTISTLGLADIGRSCETHPGQVDKSSISSAKRTSFFMLVLLFLLIGHQAKSGMDIIWYVLAPIFSSGIGAEIGDTQRFLQGSKWDRRCN
jgi:hypothetical protein